MVNSFDKKEYAKNRALKRRGQSTIEKPKVILNDTASIVFIDGEPKRANRYQRRLIKKGKLNDQENNQ